MPVSVAARYIGCSPTTLYNALQDGNAPFGFVAVTEDAKTFSKRRYTYNISPGGLIGYKKGTLSCPNPAAVLRSALAILQDVQDIAVNRRILRIPEPLVTDEIDDEE